MSQPSIITAGSVSKCFDADSDGTADSRVYSSITVPATANTMIVTVGLDTPESSSIINSLTLGSVTGSSKLHDISMSPSTTFRGSRIAVFDLRSSGAATATVTAALSATTNAKSICGVIFTDGFIESIAISQNRLVDVPTCTSAMVSGNMANNIQVFTGILDGNVNNFDFTGTGVSDIFVTIATAGGISGVAAVQSTTANDVKTITYENNAEELMYAGILISSQPNPFADIDPRGDIISHDIITN